MSSSFLSFYNHFSWKDAPLNSIEFALGTAVIYAISTAAYAFLPSARNLIRFDRVQKIIPFHNLLLCVGSLVMFLGCTYECSLRIRRENSIEWLFCERPDSEADGIDLFHY